MGRRGTFGRVARRRTGRAGSARRWLMLRARPRAANRGGGATKDAAALQVALSIGERFRLEDALAHVQRALVTESLVAISGCDVDL